MEVTAQVIVVHHPAGIRSGCKQCRKVFADGAFALGVHIVEGGRSSKYLVGVDPPVICCGEPKAVIRTFESEDAAEIEAAAVRKRLEHQGSTQSLALVAWTIPDHN